MPIEMAMPVQKRNIDYLTTTTTKLLQSLGTLPLSCFLGGSKRSPKHFILFQLPFLGAPQKMREDPIEKDTTHFRHRIWRD